MPSTVTIQRCHEHVCVCGKGKKCKHVTKTCKKTAKHVLLLLCPTSISHANPLIQVRIQINRPRNHFQALGQSSWRLGYHQEFCRRILLESGCALQEWPFYSWKGFHIWVKDKMARKQRFTPSNCVILAHSAHVFQSNIASFPANQKESTKKNDWPPGDSTSCRSLNHLKILKGSRFLTII